LPCVGADFESARQQLWYYYAIGGIFEIMQINEQFTIRTMTRSEVDFAIESAAREGWNPGLNDAECFHITDSEGFLVGILDKRPIACISAVSYPEKFGFIGFFVTVPELRGKGYGQRLWQAALTRLTGHNIGLDGVPAQVTNYVKSGFKMAYRNIRFESSSSGLPSPVCSMITGIQQISLEKIARYDRLCFPAERSKFLDCWLNQPSSAAFGYLENSRLMGYGVIRRCQQGYKIGPLFADNAAIAESLYLSLVSKTEKGSPVYLDIPEINPEALKLAEKYHMQEVFATVRMYSQGQPDLAVEKIFGVTSFELG
jgi:GNAT superfamily N-acetyltransferase